MSPALLSAEPDDVAARARREKEVWDGEEIILEQGFKKRIRAAFENPHGWKLEAERAELLRRRCPGAAVLDYGCYEGAETEVYLQYGARSVRGIDISETAIARARQRVKSPAAQFLSGDAHVLPYGDGAFDLVVGRAILHHLDLPRAYKELARVLKPGGLALFVEPLGDNPLGKLVRALTPKARTEDERPMNAADVRQGESLIGPGRHRFSGFVSAPLGAAVSLCGLKEDSAPMRLAAVLDDAVEKTPLRYWGRLVFLGFEKR